MHINVLMTYTITMTYTIYVENNFIILSLE